jgi:hypothetical protein
MYVRGSCEAVSGCAILRTVGTTAAMTTSDSMTPVTTSARQGAGRARIAALHVIKKALRTRATRIGVGRQEHPQSVRAPLLRSY